MPTKNPLAPSSSTPFRERDGNGELTSVQLDGNIVVNATRIVVVLLGVYFLLLSRTGVPSTPTLLQTMSTYRSPVSRRCTQT